MVNLYGKNDGNTCMGYCNTSKHMFMHCRESLSPIATDILAKIPYFQVWQKSTYFMLTSRQRSHVGTFFGATSCKA